MKRINLLMQHPDFRLCMHGIQQAEEKRVYCLHGLAHSLDVARISYIMNLEQKLGYKKDVVYAMALLHDIGRFEEYQHGGSHHEQSAVLAGKILEESGFDRQENAMICDAIKSHKINDGSKQDLSYLLYKADKLSRNCFACKMREDCYWSEEQKNVGITV